MKWIPIYSPTGFTGERKELTGFRCSYCKYFFTDISGLKKCPVCKEEVDKQNDTQ